MSWEFGTVYAGVSDLSAATSWGSRGSHLRLQPSSWEKPPWPEQEAGQGAAGGSSSDCRSVRVQEAGEGKLPGPRGGREPLASEVTCHVQHCRVSLPWSQAACLTPIRQG